MGKAHDFYYTKSLEYVPRTYPNAIKALAGKQVMIKGYMVSLKPAEKFRNFMLVAYPPTCPFCIQGGPNQMVEVHTDEPVSFQMEPVLVQGTYIIHDNDGSSVFYELHDAAIMP